jgi:hypothetical protein
MHAVDIRAFNHTHQSFFTAPPRNSAEHPPTEPPVKRKIPGESGKATQSRLLAVEMIPSSGDQGILTARLVPAFRASAGTSQRVPAVGVIGAATRRRRQASGLSPSAAACHAVERMPAGPDDRGGRRRAL